MSVLSTMSATKVLQHFLLLCLVIQAQSQFSRNDCPKAVPSDNYLFVHGTSCFYFVIQEAHNYQLADRYCRPHGGHLAAIGDNPTQKFLQNYLKYRFNVRGAVWIGLKNTGPGGIYVLPNGAAPQFTNWAAGEPSTMTPSNGCVVLDMALDGQWRTIPCHREFFVDTIRPFICEFPLVPDATTTSTTTTTTTPTTTTTTPTTTTTTPATTTTTPTTTTTTPTTTTTTPTTTTTTPTTTTTTPTTTTTTPTTTTTTPTTTTTTPTTTTTTPTTTTSTPTTTTTTPTTTTTTPTTTTTTPTTTTTTPTTTTTTPTTTTTTPTTTTTTPTTTTTTPTTTTTTPTTTTTTPTTTTTTPTTTTTTPTTTTTTPTTTTTTPTTTTTTPTTTTTTPTTTTPTTTTTPVPEGACPPFQCPLDCGLAGYKVDSNQCLLCACDE